MMPSIGGFSISVTANTAGLNKGFKKASGITAGFAASIGNIGSQLGGMARSAGPLALAAAIGKAASAGMNFEKSMSAVQTFVAGAADSMDQLNEKAIELGGSTVFTGTEVAGAMVELGKSGLNASEVLESISGVLSLATAGSLGIAEAAGIAGSALKQFGLDASESALVADALAKAAGSGNTTLGILGNQLTFASQAAQRAGLDFEETLGFLTFLSDGIGAEKAGRGAAAIFSAMSAPTDAARKAMDELGVSFTTTAGNFKAMPEIVGDFNSALVSLNPEEKSRLMGAIFNEQAIRGFEFALRRGSGAIDEIFEKVKLNEGFSDAVAETLIDNTSGAFTRLGSSMSAASINAWKIVDLPIRAVIEGWAMIINDTLVPAFDFLNKGLEATFSVAGWRRLGEHVKLAFESIGESIVKTFTGIEQKYGHLKLAHEDIQRIVEPKKAAQDKKSLKELATSVFGAGTFGAADAAAEKLRAKEREAAEHEFKSMALAPGFQDFMNEPLIPGLSLLRDFLPDLPKLSSDLDDDSTGDGFTSPLGVALKGSSEAFDVINKAIKGEKDAHQKTIAKESEKQTKLLQQTVDLIDGIPDAMNNPEVFSFA